MWPVKPLACTPSGRSGGALGGGCGGKKAAARGTFHDASSGWPCFTATNPAGSPLLATSAATSSLTPQGWRHASSPGLDSRYSSEVSSASPRTSVPAMMLAMSFTGRSSGPSSTPTYRSGCTLRWPPRGPPPCSENGQSVFVPRHACSAWR
eukprot:7194998-Prymnesium_polylepis.2